MNFHLFDKRTDITQQNFIKFVQDANLIGELHGFNSNGIIILTTDQRLFNLLQTYQFQRMGNTPIQVYKNLDVSKLQNKFLDKKYVNSVYYKQEDYIDPESSENVIGTKTIILTDDAEKLKEFTSYIIKFYIALCRVLHNSLRNEPAYEPESSCIMLPKMRYFITINNKISNVEFDEPNTFKTNNKYKNTVERYENMNFEIAKINELITSLISEIKSV